MSVILTFGQFASVAIESKIISTGLYLTSNNTYLITNPNEDI